MQVSSSARLSSAFLEEERRGIAWSMQGRLIALSVIAIWLSIDNFGTDTFYFLGLLGCFAALGIVFLWLSRSENYATWMKYAFMTVDAALLTFTLLVPSPFRDFVYDIQIQLRFGNFPYFFVILVGIAAFTYSPRFVVSAGVICALAWGIGASLIIFQPGTLTFRDILPNMSSDEISRITSSRNSYVISASVQSELKPTSVPVYSSGATPSQLSSAYDESAALVCPGMSISGTTVMKWSAAYSTIST